MRSLTLHSRRHMPQMQIMQMLSQPRDALHRRIRQPHTLCESQVSQLRSICDQVINGHVSEPTAPRQVHQSQVLKGIRYWPAKRGPIHGIPGVRTRRALRLVLAHVDQSWEIRDPVVREVKVAVEAELAEMGGVEEDGVEGRVG